MKEGMGTSGMGRLVAALRIAAIDYLRDIVIYPTEEEIGEQMDKWWRRAKEDKVSQVHS